MSCFRGSPHFLVRAGEVAYFPYFRVEKAIPGYGAGVIGIGYPILLTLLGKTAPKVDIGGG